MTTKWLGLILLLCVAPYERVHAAPTGKQSTTTLESLSFRPSSALGKDPSAWPTVSMTGASGPRDRILSAVYRVGNTDALAAHSSREAAVKAHARFSTEWVSQTVYHESSWNRVMHKVTSRPTAYDRRVQQGVSSTLQMYGTTLANKESSLRQIDEELSKLPADVTGGLHIGHPWGNPLLKDWHSLQKELFGVVAILDDRTPAKPRETRQAGPRPAMIRRELPSFTERVGRAIIDLTDPELARELRYEDRFVR